MSLFGDAQGQEPSPTKAIQMRELTPESPELKTLTPEDLRRLFRVEPEIQRIARERVEARGWPSDSETPKGVAASAAALNADPEFRRLLDEHEWTGREFILTLIATTRAIFAIELPDFAEAATGVGATNVRLLADPPPDLVEPLAEWKRRWGRNMERLRRDRQSPGR